MFVAISQEGLCVFYPYEFGATCTGFVNVENSESDLKAAVAEIGPISVGIDGSQPSFHAYSSG